MTLNKPSGNMYSWAYTWNPIGGECLHECGYCYVCGKIASWLARMGNPKYQGLPRLIEKELETRLVVPDGFIIFVQSCGDLFGDWIPSTWIKRVLAQIRVFDETVFLLQTKNPARFFEFVIPENCILGTSIESNRPYLLTKAPQPHDRFLAMKQLPTDRRLMVSIEPIMDFDLTTLLLWMGILRPSFVSVGADTGNNNLPEPSALKLKQLLWQLEPVTVVKRKDNLKRLLG